MNNFFLILANSSFFASRAFLTALIIVLTLKFPYLVPFLEASDYSHIPQWFTGNISVGILSLLASIEVISEKNGDLREIFLLFDKPTKMAVSSLVNFILITPENGAALQQIQQSGMSITMILPLASAGFVYFFANIRKVVYELLKDVDDDDNFKVQFLLSVIEDFWVIFGVIFLIVFPALVFLFVVIFSIIISIIKREYEIRENNKKINCPHCDESIYPSSLSCYKCGENIINPHSIGFFGQVSEKLVNHDKIGVQESNLLNAKRCPICSTKLKGKTVNQTCTCCGYSLTTENYTALIHMKNDTFKRDMLILSAVGLVPIFGMIFTIIYIKFNYVKAYKQFIPILDSLVSKWILRVLIFFLVVMQPIPLLGYVSAPIMLFVTYTYWKRVFVNNLATLKDTTTYIK